MGAAVVAARGERRAARPACFADSGQRRRRVVQAGHAGRVVGRADEYKIVVGDQHAVADVAVFEQGALGVGRVGEQHVGVALLAHAQRGAGAHGDDLHRDILLLREERGEFVE